MNRDDSKQKHFVSTFRMHIKPRSTLHIEGERTGASTTRATRPNGVDNVIDEGSNSLSPLSGLDPPLFIEPLKDCSVDEGNDITMRGIVAGTQPISISWLHNGKVAHFGKSYYDGREVRFVVKDCLPEDAGAFTCSAENSVGRTSCSAAVFVRDFETICGGRSQHTAVSTNLNPHFENNSENREAASSTRDATRDCSGSSAPLISADPSPGVGSTAKEVIPKKRATSGTAPVLRFDNPPQHIKVKQGESARLTCLFSGRPPLAACWIRNREQIVDGAEWRTENSDQSSTLVIAEAQPQHSGRYTIVVKDRNNLAEHTLTLSVIEKPEPPVSCPVVSLLTAGSLVLSWSGPCYDGGSAVLGYVVEMRSRGPRSEPGDWRELSDQCTSTSYRVCSGLQPQTDYWFRVSAFNSVGLSEPSPESPAIRMEHLEQAAPGNQLEQIHVTVDCSHKVTDHYNVLEKLGVGKFGQVFKLTHKESRHACAGKFYKGRRAKEREAARKEIELMNYLHHPKLVQCLAAYDHRPEMVMVMEFIAGGELFERIVDDNFVHTEAASVHYMQQILEGTDYMHQQDIIHLDLKPENIVCVDHMGTLIKIIDFGLASKLDHNVPLKVMHGTPEFVAPEVINYEPVCLATDMWSIGVICYILLSGESPFQGDNDSETLAFVTAAQWEFDEESFEEITEDAKTFISSLLTKDTRRRMSTQEALAHPWIAVFNSVGPTNTKSLPKDKMKRFLTRQKWKKAGKALLALKRMALLSKSESPSSPISPGEEVALSPEAEHALLTLEHKMQGAPHFSQSLEDQTVSKGSTARLSCHLTGYPDPEVVWLCGAEPIAESPRVQIEYEEDGCCTLVLAWVDLQDTSVYTCKATNTHGEALCSAKLNVKE